MNIDLNMNAGDIKNELEILNNTIAEFVEVNLKTQMDEHGIKEEVFS